MKTGQTPKPAVNKNNTNVKPNTKSVSDVKKTPLVKNTKNDEKFIGPESIADAAAATILMTNRYKRERHYTLIRILTASMILNIVLVFGIVFLAGQPARNLYFVQNGKGDIEKIVPRDKPIHAETFVVNWTVNQIMQIFSLSFHNYDDTLRRVKPNFLTGTWDDFFGELDKQLIKNLVSQKAVMKAVVVGTPFVEQGPKANMFGDGRVGYVIQIPISLRIEGNGYVKDMPYIMTVQVVRENTMNEAGIAIRRISMKQN